jgi:hypothetical protein
VAAVAAAAIAAADVLLTAALLIVVFGLLLGLALTVSTAVGSAPAGVAALLGGRSGDLLLALATGLTVAAAGLLTGLA